MNPRCNHRNTVHDTSTREIVCAAGGVVTNGFKKFVNSHPNRTKNMLEHIPQKNNKKKNGLKSKFYFDFMFILKTLFCLIAMQYKHPKE